MTCGCQADRPIKALVSGSRLSAGDKAATEHENPLALKGFTADEKISLSLSARRWGRFPCGVVSSHEFYDAKSHPTDITRSTGFSQGRLYPLTGWMDDAEIRH